MISLNIKEIGSKLKKAGKLETNPLCIYGSEKIPDNGIPIKEFNRCIAHAIFKLSQNKEVTALYVGNEFLEGCCPGGQAWLGYKPFVPQLKYFISTGSQNFRNGAAEFLLANPELAEERLNSIGKITPIGNYTVIQTSDSMIDQKINVKEILCFGQSEQIRNLCSLAYFQSDAEFTINVPWGPSCASFVTYPAGLSDIQKNSLIIGPVDPTGNYWFPQNYLSLGIPYKLAERMATNLDDSFILKRPEVAYPKNRRSD